MATTSVEDVHWVWRLFRAVGAETRAERTAETLVDEACQHVLALPDTPAKYLLLRVARYLGIRDR
jgi:geranylgeranyl pyrophosphate synthase